MVTLQNLIEFDQTILDGLTCPSPLSVDALKSNVMMTLGLCSPIYDEPEVFKSMLTTWSYTHQWNMEHLLKVNLVDYAPLENYDRIEEGNETINGNTNTSDKNVNTKNLTTTTTGDSTVNESTDTDTTSSGDTTNSVSAYNTNAFSNDTKSVNSGTSSTDTDTTTKGTNNETSKQTGSDTDDRDIKTDSKTVTTKALRTHGNVGVTTTQQMFLEEVELARTYNIYTEITKWIERDLFIQVY